MNSRALRIALAALIVSLGSSAWAESTEAPVLRRIVETNKLRVGMSGAQPPFTFTSRSGEVAGLDVDLAHFLAAAMGVTLEIKTYPFAELIPALARGETDLVISGMTATLERNLQVAFVGPYYTSGKSILAKASEIGSLQTAAQLNSPAMTLAALKGSTSQRFVEKLLPKAKLVATDEVAGGVQLVLQGKANALVADMPTCTLAVLRNPQAGLVAARKPLTVEPIGIAVPAGDSLLLNYLENFLEGMQATGVLQKLTERWFNDPSWLSQLPDADAQAARGAGARLAARR